MVKFIDIKWPVNNPIITQNFSDRHDGVDLISSSSREIKSASKCLVTQITKTENSTPKLVCENNSALKPLLRETEINTIEVFEDKNPSQSDERKGATGKGSRSDLSSLRSKDENHEQLLDIFPQAIVKKGAIYFQNYGDLLAANKTKYGWIVNTHYLAATYLFKFFMIGHHSFLDKYFNCTLLLKYGTNPKLPNTINGEYFGSANINLPWLFDAKRESCALLKIDYLDRPSFSRPGAKKGEEHYETFKVRGMQTNKLLNKTIECK